MPQNGGPKTGPKTAPKRPQNGPENGPETPRKRGSGRVPTSRGFSFSQNSIQPGRTANLTRFFQKKKTHKWAVTGRRRLYYPPSGNRISGHPANGGPGPPKPPTFSIISENRQKVLLFKKTHFSRSMRFCALCSNFLCSYVNFFFFGERRSVILNLYPPFFTYFAQKTLFLRH